MRWLSELVVQQLLRVPFEYCEPVVHCSPPGMSTPALLSRSSRRRSSRVPLSANSATASDFVSSSHSPTSSRSASHKRLRWLLQLRAREFLEPVAAQSIHPHRLVVIRHRHERVAAARRAEPLELFGHANAVEALDARTALHSEQLQKSAVFYRRRALASHSARSTPIPILRSAGGAPRATRCRCD